MAIIARRRRGDRVVRIGVMAVNLMLVIQVAAGALVVLLGLPAWVRGLHIALASLLWGCVVAVAALSMYPVDEAAPAVAATRVDALRGQAKVAQS